MSAPVAPQNEEMERALDAPPVCANLIGGGTMFVVGETGYLCSPMGMVSFAKCVQRCCCPERIQLAFAYTSGDYTEGVQVDQVTPTCCARDKMHFTMSDKDYTQPAGEEAGFVQKKLIKQARDQGMDDSKIAKMFPKKIVLGKSLASGAGPKKNEGAGVMLPDGTRRFYIKAGKTMFCQTCPMPYKNCREGVAKGRFCMNFKVPVYNQEGEIVARIVQTTPIIPLGCCTADAGPTVQMSIHKNSHDQEMSPEDAKRLGLMLFLAKPNLMNEGGWTPGGPSHFIGKLVGPLIWMKVGYLLGKQTKGVEVEYLTFSQFFNGDAFTIGDFVDRIRGKVGALKKG